MPNVANIKAAVQQVEDKVDILSIITLAFSGSGKDGSKTISTDENITPDVIYEYSTLTVEPGQTLGLTGDGKMFLRCSDKVTIAGTISSAGKGSSGGSGFAPYVPPGVENSGGLISGGSSGGAGGADPSWNGGTPAAGVSSTDDGCGSAGTAASRGMAPGGNGGDGNIGGQIITFPTELKYLMETPLNLILNGGCGGGGGSYGSGSSTQNPPGAGGSGGGCIMIIAPEIEITPSGSIDCSGDDGVDGGSMQDKGGSGAGAGGSGGTVLIMTKKITFDGGIVVAGGAGGAGGSGVGTGMGDGGDGADGSAGNYQLIMF